ncbi:hypothetical protein V8C37DRAFT_352791 [Trichoderma ceciliae]
MLSIQLRDIPSTRRDWENKAKGQGLEEHEYRSFVIPQMKSASRVDFRDWLRLKILWKISKERLTHEFLFGDKPEINRWATLPADSKAFLQKLDWYAALQSFSDNPTDWGALASWRQSTLTISRRLHFQRNIGGLKLRHQLSGEDLFASSNMWLEPMASQGNQTKADGHHNLKEDSEEMGEDGEISRKIVTRIHRDQYGLWTRPKEEPPLNANHTSSDDESSEGQASPAGLSHIKPSNQISSSSDNESSEDRASSAGNSHVTGSSASFLGAGLSRPPDEEIINMSLVLLLEGLCMYDPELRGKVGWYPIRKPFSVTQAGVKAMTARTDGCLQVIQPNQLEEDSPSLAILEAKADLRTTESSSVYLQEGAEMAAWISSECNYGLLRGSQDAGKYRRVLISQNFNQVFVNIAEYDDDYVRYITGHGAGATRASSGSPTLNLSSSQAYAPHKRASSQRQDEREETPIRDTRQPIPQPERTPSPRGGDIGHLENAPIKKKASKTPDSEYDYTKGFLVMNRFKGFKITEQRDVEELMILLVSLVRELYRGYQWNTQL